MRRLSLADNELERRILYSWNGSATCDVSGHSCSRIDAVVAVCSVTHQPTDCYKLAPLIDSWTIEGIGPVDHLLAICIKERIGRDQDTVDRIFLGTI